MHEIIVSNHIINPMVRRYIAIGFAACLIASCATAGTTGPSTAPAGQPAFARHGMVATVSPLATKAGADVLRHGGNAIDAAVAVALTLGVVDGENSGIGGGC